MMTKWPELGSNMYNFPNNDYIIVQQTSILGPNKVTSDLSHLSVTDQKKSLG